MFAVRLCPPYSDTTEAAAADATDSRDCKQLIFEIVKYSHLQRYATSTSTPKLPLRELMSMTHCPNPLYSNYVFLSAFLSLSSLL
jgi:hypothetical protein